jgi:hypothetical protein
VTPDERPPAPPPAAARPAARPAAPATGATDPRATELAPAEEPVTTGTLFLTLIILMIIAALWVIVYLRMLDR